MEPTVVVVARKKVTQKLDPLVDNLHTHHTRQVTEVARKETFHIGGGKRGQLNRDKPFSFFPYPFKLGRFTFKVGLGPKNNLVVITKSLLRQLVGSLCFKYL